MKVFLDCVLPTEEVAVARWKAVQPIISVSLMEVENGPRRLQSSDVVVAVTVRKLRRVESFAADGGGRRCNKHNVGEASV